MQVAYIPMNSVKCGILTALYRGSIELPKSTEHTCDSTAGSQKIPFSKPVCRSTVPVDQTTVFKNFRKYYENPIKKCPNITVPACASLIDANQFINQPHTRLR